MGEVQRNTSIVLLAVGHACVDIYQGAVAALIPFFVAERDYTYAVASGIVLAASLLSSVAQPLFGLLTAGGRCRGCCRSAPCWAEWASR
ncbi:hypothetical protein SROCM77S_00480 [Streptomyces rochei]